MRTMWAAAALAAATGGAAAAQGFAGAEVSAEILGFTEDADLGETRYAGGAEFDLLAGLSAGANLAFHTSRGFDADGRNLTLHGSYALGPETAAGLFYARDGLSDADELGIDDANLYGVEGATFFRGFAVEAAAGRFESDDTFLSAEAAYEFGRFAVVGSAAALRGDAEASRLALGGELRLGAGPAFFAEVGRVRVSADDAALDDRSEAYLSLGARVAIGPNRGTTFGNRGVFEVVPGF